MENFLNINALTKGEPYRFERRLIWVYLWLLIFEGALRKWVLPGLATPLLVVRDPIVVILVISALQKGWLKNAYVRTMMVVSTVSLVATMIFGHQNLIVGIFGWRIYFFHFPMIFVMGKVLSRDDVLKMCRFVLYLSIPMTVLVVMQFYSPQEAWVNRGVGGDMEGAGFSGANGYYRPPGTFSFTAGYTAYQGIVGSILFFYAIANNRLDAKDKLPNLLILAMIACYIVSIPTSISRTLYFTTIGYVAALFLVSANNNYIRKPLYQLATVVVLIVVFAVVSGKFGEQLDAFTARYDGANKSEGGAVEGALGNRYLGSFIRGVLNFDLPIFGYGLGIGTAAGAKLAGSAGRDDYFNAEEEFSRVTGECGLLIGWIVLAIRLGFASELVIKSYKVVKTQKDLLPWMLSVSAFLSLTNNNWGVPTGLGMAIFSGGLALASLNNNKQEAYSPCASSTSTATR